MKKIKLTIILVGALILILILLFFLNNKPSKVYNNSLFEAKIDEELLLNNSNIVYIGEKEDEAKIKECYSGENKYYCSFLLLIKIDSEASKRFADITSKIELNSTPSCVERNLQGDLVKLFILSSPNANCPGAKEYHLIKNLNLYLNGELFSYLQINKDIKGEAIKQIIISGEGNGTTIQEAITSTRKIIEGLQNIKIGS